MLDTKVPTSPSEEQRLRSLYQLVGWEITDSYLVLKSICLASIITNPRCKPRKKNKQNTIPV